MNIKEYPDLQRFIEAFKEQVRLVDESITSDIDMWDYYRFNFHEKELVDSSGAVLYQIYVVQKDSNIKISRLDGSGDLRFNPHFFAVWAREQQYSIRSPMNIP